MTRRKAKTDAMLAQPGTLESGYTLKVDYDPENADDFSAKAIYNDGTVKELTAGGGGGEAHNILDGSAAGSLRTVGSAEEDSNYTIGVNAFSQGYYARAYGKGSHAEGNNTKAKGEYSHAEGQKTTAFGSNSHAEGSDTMASGSIAHAEGMGTIAQGNCQHAGGKYNVADSHEAYAFIIGNGESDKARSNAFAIKWDGTIVVWNNGTAVELTPAKLAELIGG